MQPTPADATPAAPAAPHFSTPPPEVRVTTQFTGVALEIYHPDTRTLYLWTGTPKPQTKEQMHCFKIQLSDTPSGTPQRMECEYQHEEPDRYVLCEISGAGRRARHL